MAFESRLLQLSLAESNGLCRTMARTAALNLGDLAQYMESNKTTIVSGSDSFCRAWDAFSVFNTVILATYSSLANAKESAIHSLLRCDNNLLHNVFTHLCWHRHTQHHPIPVESTELMTPRRSTDHSNPRRNVVDCRQTDYLWSHMGNLRSFTM